MARTVHVRSTLGTITIVQEDEWLWTATGFGCPEHFSTFAVALGWAVPIVSDRGTLATRADAYDVLFSGADLASAKTTAHLIDLVTG